MIGFLKDTISPGPVVLNFENPERLFTQSAGTHPRVSDSRGLRSGLSICISNNVGEADMRTALWR